MENMPACPKCKEEFTYVDGDNYVCPMCGHEWSQLETGTKEKKVFDSNGVELQNGDTVTVIKDLKIKGSSNSVKIGTKIKNIRLQEGDHNIACKIDGFGAMNLKSEFVKKQ